MSPVRPARRIVFLARALTGESLRSAQAIRKLDGVCLLGICERRPGDHARQVFEELVRVADVHDMDQLITVGRALTEKHGSLDRIVTTTETLLEPAAQASEALGILGMSVVTVRRALDKSCLKSILRGAGIDTGRDRVVTGKDEARCFASEAGFPIVLKPLRGSGGLATWRIPDPERLELALELLRPSPEKALLAEVYLRGQELCFDTITLGNEPRFYSICRYRPSVLEALEDPSIQWTCVMPREMSDPRYRDFIGQGLAAVRALAVGNAMTHMEGFLLTERGIRFTDATLRPAGARIGPMLAHACDMDPYLAWARIAVDGCFDGPWERKFAVGTVFLRGTGRGLVQDVLGADSVKRLLGGLLVDARFPRVGAAKSATYTGDGYLTVRHPKTEVVEDALRLIAQTVRIAYTETSPSGGREELWSQRLGYFDKQLNKPAWDDDALSGEAGLAYE